MIEWSNRKRKTRSWHSKFAIVQGPTRWAILTPRPPRLLYEFSFPFFFILTLIGSREIKNTLEYGGKPALHIVELTAMDCPTGPFRSQFLMFYLFTVLVALLRCDGGEVFHGTGPRY